MTIDKEELGRRLKKARESARMTQEAVATELEVTRPAISQIESGARAVNSLELDRLAYLYGRDIREFLSNEFTEKESLVALFRANPDMDENDQLMDKLRHSIAFARERANLEKLLEINRSLSSAAYNLGMPSSKWKAIQQGEQVADEERGRLGLGVGPLESLPEILEGEGIHARGENLADDISGFTMNEPSIGPVVVVNSAHKEVRQRYSFAHEYAHALIDRQRIGLVSRHSDAANLLEVRANAFAAAFLMPEKGVKQFLASIGKDKVARNYAEVFDEANVLEVEGRSADRHVKLYDVVQLAHYFGVSRLSAIYRLLNLRLISAPERKELIAADSKSGQKMETLLGLHERWEKGTFNSTHRFLALGLEALRRDEISQSKFKELARLADLAESKIKQLLKESQLLEK